MTKLKGFADNKLNVAKMMISLFDGIENTVGKGGSLSQSLRIDDIHWDRIHPSWPNNMFPKATEKTH